MPPSSKRRTRQRDVDFHETSDMELPDSSPSRPSAKKRKVNGGRVSPHVKARTPEPAPYDIIEAGAHPGVDAVIASLAVPKESTTAMREFANTKQSDLDVTVQAYAKIAGRTWTYYVKKTRVNIGRPREDAEGSHRLDLQSSPGALDDGSLPVDIDLGPSKYVSRHHASIYYDDDERWCVEVNGRNGIRVNNRAVRRGETAELSCGDILEISNTQMIFVTPESEPIIDPVFLERAQKQVAGEEAETWNNQRGPPSDAQGAHPRSPGRGPDPIQTYLPPGQVPLAPAPPYFKRQTTPKSERRQDMDRNVKQSPLYNRGMMMESTEEIDFSKDAAKDLKPPFSYATMIAQAILSSEEEKLTLNNIYQWIMEKYAFYRHSQTGWQNSIRHNLSLNKAFQKVPRRTDEPGKGMKWQIAPESRDEFLKKQAPRKSGHSSAPNSPASKDYSVFKTSGPVPGYDRSYENRFSVTQPSPQQGSPALPNHSHFNSFPAGPPEAYTPERGSRPRNPYDANNTEIPSDFNDDSPLPSRPRQRINTSHLTSAAQAREATSPPTLSSSFFTDGDNPPMITPAPRRQQPRLAPPSTAQLPSKFMPQSSPAPFWTMANLGTGTTPRPGLGESSPLKGGRGLDDLPSSSPPPPLQRGGVGEMGSPTKRASPRPRYNQAAENTVVSSTASQETLPAPAERVQSPSRDNTQSQSADGAPASSNNGVAVATNGVGCGASVPVKSEGGDKPEAREDGGVDGGFDLAKGFQPIGSFHANLREVGKAGGSG